MDMAIALLDTIHPSYTNPMMYWVRIPVSHSSSIFLFRGLQVGCECLESGRPVLYQQFRGWLYPEQYESRGLYGFSHLKQLVCGLARQDFQRQFEFLLAAIGSWICGYDLCNLNKIRATSPYREQTTHIFQMTSLSISSMSDRLLTTSANSIGP